MKKHNAKYFVNNDSLFSHGAIIFFVLSCVFCLLGSIGNWNDRFYIVSQVALPVACSVVFVIFLLIFGNRMLWMTCFPAVVGLAFFVIWAFSYGNVVYSAISIALSIVSAFLYTAVCFGWIKIKWPLIPVFIMDFFFHVFFRDYNTLKTPGATVSFSGIMQEISVLFIILAMLFVSFAMKNKRDIESMNLPKIKTPKVIVKKDSEKTGTAETQENETPKLEENIKESLPVVSEAAQTETTEPVEISETAEEAKPESTVIAEHEEEKIENKPDTGADI